MTQYYSRSDTAYSGSAIFSIPFSYINKNNINVKIIREVSDEETEIDATFTWLNDTQITVTSELQEGDIVSIRRNTPINQKIVTYQNQSMILDEDNLNLSQDQVLNAVQEMRDDNVTFQLDIDEEFEEYKDEIEGSFESYKDIVDSALNTIDGKADTAIDKADSAITTANTAEGKADTAISTANTAEGKADNAISTANSASTTAGTALSTANSASTTAGNAVTTANAASQTATNANNKVDAFGDDIAAVISAADKINQLQEAVTTATNAASTASDKATEATNAANRAEAVIPTQTGNNGKFLQTDGTNTSWQTITIPEQTQADWNQSDTTADNYIKNKPDLTTKQDTLISGTNIKTINNNPILGSGNLVLDGLPSQTGQSGKYLTTDGTNPSWSNVDALPSQTGHSGDVLTTDGTDASWTDTAEVYPVIETYSNGTSWYRIYAPDSTGYRWCEQGGKYTVASSSPHTMNLLKEMKDTSYNITLTAGVAGAGDATVQIHVRTDLITTTSFAIQKQWTSNNGYYFWEVKGYIEVE